MVENDLNVPAPAGLSGLWGEGIAVIELRGLGFTVKWEGGFTPGRDLIVSRGGKSWMVQVKCTQAKDSHIYWAKDGERARALQEEAVRKGFEGAFFVMVQIPKSSNASLNLETAQLVIDMPSDYRVTATSALIFGHNVDFNRADYATQRRVQGKKEGVPFTANDLKQPIYANEYFELAEFVEKRLDHIANIDA